MLDNVVSIITTAFMVTAVGIALRPNSPLPKVIEATGTALSRSQTAAFGPSK